jgi:hypothetical protein
MCHMRRRIHVSYTQKRDTRGHVSYEEEDTCVI